ncbi:NAD(P)/FAD-dependent oxidoreductase [Coraliomargarita algicola]|uniref:NAD(P)/FAD-dependent oxidoreductase n=1 Tax=Coraliomargarita algicola TaxID=3092156 RepID=A0ABZ0RJZ2_9BACT|nr:NAD(P)/FAD-dependent oxidoreductase [Coraliomargarita sp. J2-16]WPJ95862.1 NAD(P)/FAD-dependent oxidoreductase [Coraliomargarita sp. J2-16]
MFNKKSVDIAVLGAGPVGLTAAHILADRGMDFTLLERAASPHAHSYALALHPDTLELLDTLGVIAPVLKHALRLRRSTIFDQANKQRAIINYSELSGKYPFLAVIPQSQLETILVESLARKGHKPMWNHRARCITPSAEGVHFTVDHLLEGSTGYAISHTEQEIEKVYEYQTNYMIAADGYESMARKAAGIAFPEIKSSLDYAVFEFETNTRLLTEMRMMVDHDKTHIYWPLGNGRCRFSFQMPPNFAQKHSFNKDHGMVDNQAQESSELSNEHLDHLLRTYAPWFIGSSQDVKWRVMVHFEKHLAESFGHERIWLAGDAAHMAAPAGILSMNVGMLEGADLAEKLSIDTDHDGRQFRLNAYNLDRVTEWRRLFDVDQNIVGEGKAAEWLLRHRSSIIGNIPASGQTYTEILEQLKLHETVAA